MMNEKEKFCRSLEWEIDIKWFGLTGYSSIDENRRAKIILSDRGHHEHYSEFIVHVLDKNDGRIDVTSFSFDDYLNRRKRTDTEQDYPPGNNRCFQVVAYCGWRWHVAVPGATRPLCAEIEKYILIFR